MSKNKSLKIPVDSKPRSNFCFKWLRTKMSLIFQVVVDQHVGIQDQEQKYSEDYLSFCKLNS
jgi:hypothetical protein